MSQQFKIESLGVRRCSHCGNGQGEVKRITTTVEGTTPVEMGYCSTCGGSLT